MPNPRLIGIGPRHRGTTALDASADDSAAARYDRGATSPKPHFLERTRVPVTTPSAPLRRGATIFMDALLILAVAACSNGGGDNTGGGTIAVENGAAEINADEIAFDASTIEAPAGEEFTITLNNLESQPHNFAVYVEDGGELIARSDTITGPDVSADAVIPALDPGTYFFKCDVHPEMNGTIVVEGAASSG